MSCGAAVSQPEMLGDRPVPTSLKSVAILFILADIYAVIEVLVSFVHQYHHRLVFLVRASNVAERP